MPLPLPAFRTPSRTFHASGARRSGFSLIEVLIVVAIIAFLFLLTLRIRDSWKNTSARQACSAAMACMLNAAKNHDRIVPVPLDHAEAPGYFVDLASNGTKNRALSPMEFFVFRASPR